jgi:hypothetical protein
LDSVEESRFPRLISAIGGVASGFTLGKADTIASFISDHFSRPTNDPVETLFLFLAPLSCFFAGLISSFVVRSAIVSIHHNRRMLLHRELEETVQMRTVVSAEHDPQHSHAVGT